MCDFTGFARASVQVLEDYAPNTYTAAFAISKPWQQVLRHIGLVPRTTALRLLVSQTLFSR